MATLGTLSVAIDSDIGGLKRGLAAAASSLGKFAGPVAAVGAGVAAVGVGAVKMAADFESQMAKIKGLVGVSQKQVDAWGQDILQLAPKLSKSPQELAEALFFVSSAGFRGQEAIDVLTASAQASTAGLGETKVIADAVTSAVNAYGIENLSASRATDILTAAVRQGKLEAESLAPVLGGLLPLGAELGITFDQVAGFLAAMSRTGLDANKSATALRGIMNKLIKPSQQAQETLADVGLSAQGLREQVREKGLLSVLRLLQRRFKGNQEAMGRVFEDVEGLNGVLNILGQRNRTVNRIMRRVRKSLGLTGEAYRTQKDTAKALWDELKAHLEVIMIRLGNTLLPKVKNALGTINEVIGRLTGTSKEKIPRVKKAFRRGMSDTGGVIPTVDNAANSIVNFIEQLKSIAEGINTWVVNPVRTAIDWLNKLFESAERRAPFAGASITTSRRPFQRAHGGPVTAGQSFLVGERGPELFIPNLSGRIVANDKMGGITLNFNAPVFGMNDFESQVKRAMGRAMARAGAA